MTNQQHITYRQHHNQPQPPAQVVDDAEFSYTHCGHQQDLTPEPRQPIR